MYTMKRKFLAVVAALAIMTVGTTAFAAESPEAGKTTVTKDATQEATVAEVAKPTATPEQMASATAASASNGADITAVAVQETTITETVKAAKNVISNLSTLATVLNSSTLKSAAKDSSKQVSASITTVVNLQGSISKGTTLTITNAGIKAGKTYAILHYENGNWVTIKATNVKDYSLQFVADSLSPFAVVEITVADKAVTPTSNTSTSNTSTSNKLTSNSSDATASVVPASNGTKSNGTKSNGSGRSLLKSSSSDTSGTSPKTGETTPLALIGLLVCAAGAFACSKRSQRR
jgi:hypothetical protein